MSVEVRLPTLLRRHADGKAVLEADGANLSEVIRDLVDRYPGLGDQLTGEDGGLHKFMNVYVNDDDVRYTGKLDTPVKDGDSVTVLPAVAGG